VNEIGEANLDRLLTFYTEQAAMRAKRGSAGVEEEASGAVEGTTSACAETRRAKRHRGSAEPMEVEGDQTEELHSCESVGSDDVVMSALLNGHTHIQASRGEAIPRTGSSASSCAQSNARSTMVT